MAAAAGAMAAEEGQPPAAAEVTEAAQTPTVHHRAVAVGAVEAVEPGASATSARRQVGLERGTRAYDVRPSVFYWHLQNCCPVLDAN